MAQVLGRRRENTAMNKPRVICHMMTTVDGRIIMEHLGERERSNRMRGYYEAKHKTYNGQAWLCGRQTMEKDFAAGVSPEIPGTGPAERLDYIADHRADSFAIAMDRNGKLAWERGDIEGDHLVVVLAESVENGYLTYLQDRGISYIFGGKEDVALSVVLDKLYVSFGIRTLMLEGGGHINGAFLNEGLIDELSLLLLPVADGTVGAPTLFEVSEYKVKRGATDMKLLGTEQLEEGVLWIRYSLSL